MKTLTSIPEHSHYLELLNRTALSKWESHLKRVNFGKQPLAIYQFVPCKLVDGECVVLEEPEEYKEYLNLRLLDSFNNIKELGKCALYQEALDKVLFEGCILMDGWCLKLPCGYLLGSEESLNFRTIEDLVTYNLPLTKTALKEIGL